MTKKKSFKKGWRKPRVPRPLKDKGIPKDYDSMLEYTLHSTVLKDWEFHGDKIPYTVEHNYHPDFIRRFEGHEILLEVKGRFWDYAEFSKYIWIREALKPNQELVFLFANPSTPMPAAKLRKDGTKRSHGEWATAKGFRWFSEDSIPKHWIDTTKQDGEEL